MDQTGQKPHEVKVQIIRHNRCHNQVFWIGEELYCPSCRIMVNIRDLNKIEFTNTRQNHIPYQNPDTDRVHWKTRIKAREDEDGESGI